MKSDKVNIIRYSIVNLNFMHVNVTYAKHELKIHKRIYAIHLNRKRSNVAKCVDSEIFECFVCLG